MLAHFLRFGASWTLLGAFGALGALGRSLPIFSAWGTHFGERIVKNHVSSLREREI